ncbi:hypothetical protein D3C72_1947130 [compost metagenome]
MVPPGTACSSAWACAGPGFKARVRVWPDTTTGASDGTGGLPGTGCPASWAKATDKPSALRVRLDANWRKTGDVMTVLPRKAEWLDYQDR